MRCGVMLQHGPGLSVEDPCVLPAGHDGVHERACGMPVDPDAPETAACVLPLGHDGTHTDAEVSGTCSAMLNSIGYTFTCELNPGHDGEHRGRRYPPPDGVDEPPTFWSDDAVGAVLPGRAAETSSGSSESGSGAQNEPWPASGVVPHEHEGGDIQDGYIYCSHGGCRARARISDGDAAKWIWTTDPVALKFEEEQPEEFEATAPLFATEIHVTSMMFWVQRHPDGMRELKIVGAVRTPAGMVPMPPAYSFRLTAEGWSAFRKTIEDDGEPKPHIVRATHLPPGVEM